MAITISGENNNDKILASDGVIDSLSSLNIAGIATATTFVGNLTGNVTGDVGGNLTGNVTGNINNTTLLLQTGGYERVRITDDGKILIGRTSASHSSSTMEILSSSAESYLRISPNTNTGTAGVIFGTADDHSTGGIFYQGSDDALVLAGHNNEERLRIDSGGRLLLGHTSSQDVYATSKLQIQGTTAATSSLSLLRHGNSPYLTLGSSGGSSLGAVNALSSGDRIGQISFAGADGTDINTHAASISAYVDGTVSSNNVPAHIRFATGPSETERVRIQKGGLKLNGGSYIVECEEGGQGNTNNNTKIMDQRRWMWYGTSSSTHTVARVAKAASGQPGDGDSQLAAWIVTYTARSMYGFNSGGGYSVMKMRTGRFDYNDNEVRFSTEQDTLGTGGGSQNPTIVFTDEGSGVVRIDITNPSSTHSFGEINLMTYDCRITLPTG